MNACFVEHGKLKITTPDILQKDWIIRPLPNSTIFPVNWQMFELYLGHHSVSEDEIARVTWSHVAPPRLQVSSHTNTHDCESLTLFCSETPNHNHNFEDTLCSYPSMLHNGWIPAAIPVNVIIVDVATAFQELCGPQRFHTETMAMQLYWVLVPEELANNCCT